MDFSTLREKLNSKGSFETIKRRTRRNDTLADWYNNLYEETGEERFDRKATALKSCCKIWDTEYYRLQGVKDIKRTNHCNDRFCENCQSLNAKQREDKFTPFLDTFKRHFDIYHIVFTVTNPTHDKLFDTVENMFKQFGYIIRLFRGNAKIKGYDFLRYGFVGAIRALEITKSKDGLTFHPHFHTLFLMKKGLKLDTDGKTHVNDYSFDNTRNGAIYKFSDFEILLQKIWRLRYDGIKVNAENIKLLPIGYSVKLNRPKNYHEVFKYATKGIFKENASPVDGERDFRILQRTLDGRRIIQGYGALNGFKFDDSNEEDFDYIDTLSKVIGAIYDDKEKIDTEYENFISALKSVEDPVKLYEYFEDIFKEFDSKNIKYVSRASIYELLTAGGAKNG